MPNGARTSRSYSARCASTTNRERLVAVATAAFAERGPDVSLEEIARRAGVGIGTLYRHFPTRGAMVEAVYRREVERLADAAAPLLASTSPGAALRAWMHLFVDYIATKKVITPALACVVGGGSALAATARPRVEDAIALLVDRAVADGEVRSDVVPADLLRALVGFTYVDAGPDWVASARRLVDLLMDGLQRPRSPA